MRQYISSRRNMRQKLLWTAIGLTIWFDLAAALILWLPPAVVARFESPATVVALSSYVLMPIRWTIVLSLAIQAVRARRRAMLALRIAFVVVGLSFLGVLSLVGWLMIGVSATRSDHVIGVVLHTVLPTVVVFGLARSMSRSGLLQQRV